MPAQFRPCIDLHQGKVKQIVGSTLNDEGAVTNFVAEHSPAYYAELYRQDNLTGGHVIMLGPGNEEAARNALAAWPGGLQVGGGIHTANAQSWLDAGAAQVIVTSAVFHDGELDREELKRLDKTVGRERLVLDLSCRKLEDGSYRVVTDRWQKFTRLEVNRETLTLLADSTCEFLIHAVDVEGKQAGIDRELIALLAEHSPIDCVYAGGISTLDDIRHIQSAGSGRIHFTVGSALDLFGGSLPYSAILRLLQQSAN